MDTCSRAHTHLCTHTLPSVMVLCTLALRHCPCRGVTLCTLALCWQPGPRKQQPWAAQLPPHRLQQGLCLGGCPNALQPLRSHSPRQCGDSASKVSSRHWPRHCLGHWPSVGTASPSPAEAMPAAREDAWHKCMGLARLCGAGSVGPCLPAPSGQAEPKQSPGQRHTELPASLAALCDAAWGPAPTCQGRDRLKATWLPGPVCTNKSREMV